MKRGSGILAHITSLPSPYGVGDLGTHAYQFVDLLNHAGQAYWQMLPITPTSDGGCPYSSYSAFGGFPLLIAPDKLIEDGLLSTSDLQTFPRPSNEERVDFVSAGKSKDALYRKAFQNFGSVKDLQESYQKFIEQEASWVNDLACFEVLTKVYGEDWNQWPSPFNRYNSQTIALLKNNYRDEINYRIFLQFIFYRQWSALRNYANSKKIKLIGDLPIFLSYHSVDAWKNPTNFKLDDNFQMLIETGAAPDAFSQSGQKWSTPNYNWTKIKKDKFTFWIKRFDHLHHMFDIIRIDHFRGFCHVWESHTTSKTAEHGWWAQTPGEELFTTLKQKFPDFPIIIEDLGEITPDVIKLKDKFTFPGMKVLQFAFGSDATNEHLPENYTENCVVYTATHDCNTTFGHFNSLPEGKEKVFVENYLHISNLSNIHWDLIKLAQKSKAKLAIFPLQDLLGLGTSARFNLPGTVSEMNWTWRVQSNQLDLQLFEKLKTLTTDGIRHVNH